VTGLVLAVAGAYGVHLVFTAFAYQWRGLRPGPASAGGRDRRAVRDWLVQAGLGDLRPAELGSILGVLVAIGAGAG